MIDRLHAEMSERWKYCEMARGLVYVEPRLPSSHHHTGYKTVGLGGKNYLEHRVVWFLAHGQWPKGEIDHINRDKHDNRIENLRVVSKSQNARNRGLMKSNRTGVTGVSIDGNRFVVKLSIDGKPRSFGRFKTLEEASAIARSQISIRDAGASL